MQNTTSGDGQNGDLLDLLLASGERQRNRLAALRAAVEANDADATGAELLNLHEIGVDEAALMVSCAIAKDASSALAALGEGGALAPPVLLATRAQEPPLLAAVKARSASCAAVLIGHGADPELSTMKGPGDARAFDEHPLDTALANGDAACARLLLPKSDMNRLNSRGQPALAAAASSPVAECFEAALAWSKPNKHRLKGETILASLVAFADAQDQRDPQSDLILLAKMQALAPLLKPDVWRIGAPTGGWAARLAHHKWPNTLAWMARSNLGFKPDANLAIVNWAIGPFFDEGEQNAALVALDAMLPHAALRDAARAPLPKLAKALKRQIALVSAAGVSPRRQDWLWAVADRVAAFDPLQPGAQSLWKLAQGNLSKAPRLNAAVEAEVLRNALAGKTSAHDSPIGNASSSTPARSEGLFPGSASAASPRAAFAEQPASDALDLKPSGKATKRL